MLSQNQAVNQKQDFIKMQPQFEIQYIGMIVMDNPNLHDMQINNMQQNCFWSPYVIINIQHLQLISIKLFIFMQRPRKENSEGDFMRSEIKNNKYSQHNKLNPKQLISLQKDYYKIFNQFQFNESRLASVQEYQKIVLQIKNFNIQIAMWKDNTHNISNVRLTYNLYQNLVSRIRYVNNFSLNNQSAISMLNQIYAWFLSQKPKIRGSPPSKPQPILKQSLKDEEQFYQIEYLTQTSIKNRHMKPYEVMARTSHKQFFPPKQRLMDYNTKQLTALKIFSELDDEDQRKTNCIDNKKSMGTTFSTLKGTRTSFKSKSKYSQSQLTKTNTQNMKQSSNNQNEAQIKQFNVQNNQSNHLLNSNNQAQKNDIQADNNDIQADNNDIQSNKNDIANQLIDQPKFQEDDPDQLSSNALQDQQTQQKQKKIFQSDNLATDIMIAQQKIKAEKQSTLRRILQQKQHQIASKLQQLDLKKSMIHWGKIKSSRTTEQNRKLQRIKLVNNYKNVQFKKKVNPQQTTRKWSLFDLKGRSATSEGQRIPFQSSIENNKINGIMKTFGRYIDGHVKVANFKDENNQLSENQMMRTTSLTNFACMSKKKQFGQVLQNYDTHKYNDDIYNEINDVKDKLSKKLLSVEKKSLYTAIGLVSVGQKNNIVQIYPRSSSLLSNPFFPKSKPAKKKK